MNLLNNSSPVASHSARLARLAAVALVLGGTTLAALAQYKIVGPDGKVTYTDKPPTPGDIRLGGSGAAAQDANAGMSYETRQAMSRYPVTLYAAAKCSPCDSVRQWLRQHAIPFNEYSIDGNADRAALQERFGEPVVPVTTIGSTTLKGFPAADLQSYVAAAGYPSQGRLTGYSWPPAKPLAPRNATPAPAAAPPVAATAPPLPASKNGIQF